MKLYISLVVLLGATVSFIYLGLEFEQYSAALYVAAGVCLAATIALGLLSGKNTVQTILELLRPLIPPLDWFLSLEHRRQELRAALDDVTQTLQHFRRQAPTQSQLDEIAKEPPNVGEEILQAACKAIAEKLGGNRDPLVLELLHRGLHDSDTSTFWKHADEELRWELATLLALSGRLTGFEATRMTEALAWIFRRVREFRLEAIEHELRCLELIWTSLDSFSKFLQENHGEPHEEDLFDTLLTVLDEALAGAMLSQTDLGELTEEVLIEICGPWIRAAAGGNSATPDVVENLTLIALGIFHTEVAPSGPPWLSRLSSKVARKPQALRMLFGYLWRKSLVSEGVSTTPRLSVLAAGWNGWASAAEGEMGKHLSKAIYGELRSQLLNRLWPSWLPIASTVDQFAQQSDEVRKRLDRLSESLDKDPGWRQEIEALLTWANAMDESVRDLAPEALVEKVSAAIVEKERAFLPQPENGSGDEPAVRKTLEKYVERFRPETRLAGMLTTLAQFRDEADDLIRQLEDLEGWLKAESTGGSAYLITFDQTRGALAHLIDALGDKYGFRHYTRYARYGELRPGLAFEKLYAGLEADLEKLIEVAVNQPQQLIKVGVPLGADHKQLQAVIHALNGHQNATDEEQEADWTDLRITVQRISLLYRHEFVTDAEALREKLPPEVFAKTFRVPTSSALVDDRSTI